MSAPAVREPEVLVVGAGPVGLLLACELARRGVSIRVVDELASPTTESRAIIVHARSLEMLERAGVAEEIISTGIRLTGAEFHLDRRTEARISLDTVDSPYPFSISLPQTDTERILTNRLLTLGVEVDRGVAFLGFDGDDEGVTALLRTGDGGEESVRCAYLAGTDGSRSTVRHACGTRLEGSFEGERFLLADVEAEYELDRTTMHSYFTTNESPLLLFPMRGERRADAARDARDRRPTRPWHQAAQGALADRVRDPPRSGSLLPLRTGLSRRRCRTRSTSPGSWLSPPTRGRHRGYSTATMRSATPSPPGLSRRPRA